MVKTYKSVFADPFAELEELVAKRKGKQQKKLEQIKAEDDALKKKYSACFNDNFKVRIKNRDNNECYLCKKKEDLTVHHISYQKLKTNEKYVVTLCRGCNSRVNKKSERKEWEEYFQKELHFKIGNKGGKNE